MESVVETVRTPFCTGANATACPTKQVTISLKQSFIFPLRYTVYQTAGVMDAVMAKSLKNLAVKSIFRGYENKSVVP